MPVAEHLKDIDFFVNVANAGSFIAAAERMNLTSSAVSKGVARLEKRLQVRLFERTTRRLLLSDSGQPITEPAAECWPRSPKPRWPCMMN